MTQTHISLPFEDRYEPLLPFFFFWWFGVWEGQSFMHLASPAICINTFMGVISQATAGVVGEERILQSALSSLTEFH